MCIIFICRVYSSCADFFFVSHTFICVLRFAYDCLTHGYTKLSWHMSMIACCSVLQCVAVCCSVLQCVSVYCTHVDVTLTCIYLRVLPFVAARCSVLHACGCYEYMHLFASVAVCYSVLQCVAVCCSVSHACGCY